jgi:hypothetical protein
VNHNMDLDISMLAYAVTSSDLMQDMYLCFFSHCRFLTKVDSLYKYYVELYHSLKYILCA